MARIDTAIGNAEWLEARAEENEWNPYTSAHHLIRHLVQVAAMSRWPRVPLGELIHRADEVATLDPETEYHEVTVKLWGKGVVSRGKVLGGEVGAARHFVRAGNLILSKIDARNGAIGVVPPELDGAIVSNDFPSYAFRDSARCHPAFMGWLVRSSRFVELCKASSEGTTNRVRLKEERFLEQEIPFPPLSEQKSVVARLDTLEAKAREVAAHLDAIERDAERLLAGRFRAAIADAPYRPMAEVAPHWCGGRSKSTWKAVTPSWASALSVRAHSTSRRSTVLRSAASAFFAPRSATCCFPTYSPGKGPSPWPGQRIPAVSDRTASSPVWRIAVSPAPIFCATTA
jgi:hypothetical protein